MATLDDFPQALIPEPPIKQGRAEQMGTPGQRISVTVGNITRQYTCATVVNSTNVQVVGDRVFCGSAPVTNLVRTSEYARFRPLGKTVETSLIKYLYSTANGTGRDLYVGGYQAEPVRVGAVTSSEQIIRLTNLGSDQWLIDLLKILDSTSSQFCTRTEAGSDLYTSRILTGFEDRIARRAGKNLYGARQSFVTRTEQPEPGELSDKYIKVFQGIVETGDASSLSGQNVLGYVLPNLSYRRTSSSAPFFLVSAINQAGTTGVGLTNVPSLTVAWFDTSIHSTAVPLQFAPFQLANSSDWVDCFDDRYTVFSLPGSNLAADQAEESIKVTLKSYGPDALELSASDAITVYTVPAEQRSSAIVLDASYHPD